MIRPDLDALEKLADEATPGEWTTYLSGAPEYNNVTHGIEIGPDGPLVVGAFERKQDCDYVHSVQPATIKALIAELKEARGLLENIHERATEGHTKAGCDNWRAVERCRQIANLTERAFLARNGKGEEPHTPRNAPRGLSDEC